MLAAATPTFLGTVLKTDDITILIMWFAVVIGIIASLMVLHSAHTIGSGAIRGVYNRFGVGMFIIVAALVAVAAPQWAPPIVIVQVHAGLIILGFTIMAFGARRLLKIAGLR